MLTQRLTKLNRNNESGFSLLEILITLLILGILAGIAIPFFLNQQKATDATQLQANLLRASIQIASDENTEGLGGQVLTENDPTNQLDVGTQALIYSYSDNKLRSCLEGTVNDTNYFLASWTKTVSQTDCTQANVVPNSYADKK
jgi:prepilin-type N-terminal cleavage/methylation domain-containing protein